MSGVHVPLSRKWDNHDGSEKWEYKASVPSKKILHWANVRFVAH